jgi:predicted nucleic acid-binding protein
MKILLDTNVVLDIALKRHPFYEAAVEVFEASNFDTVHLFITASIATDLYYILRKEKDHETAIAFITDLLKCMDACKVDKGTLLEAIGSGFPDFEDAVQNFAAVESAVEMILSRNKNDFGSSSLRVLTPDEFVKGHLPQLLDS